MSRSTSIQKWKPFEMMVDTTIAGDSGVGSFRIDTDNTSSWQYRYKVDWGDGSVSAITSDSDITHTYSSSGTYIVKIYGRVDRLHYNNSNEADKIISINSWGNIPWKAATNMFLGASNLTGVTTSESPNFESLQNHNEIYISSTAGMFQGCTNLDSDFISNWDFSNVLLMGNMFRDCTNFNNGGSPSISGLTLTGGIGFHYMQQWFWGASNFNQPIGSWDVSDVTTFQYMFYNASSFDQDLGSWDLYHGSLGSTAVEYMFYGSNFNNGGSPSISGWTMSGITSLDAMFRNSQFNQPIGSWDVSNVTDMGYLFYNTPFNQDLSNWDVSNVQFMDYMFFGTPFSGGGISNWVTSACTDMSGMFYNADAFDEDLNSWDVSNVQNMSQMFRDTTYNKPLSGWSTDSLTNMSSMFYFNTAFNQDLNNFDTSKVTNFSSLFQSNAGSNFNNGEASGLSTNPLTWDTRSAITMRQMFDRANDFNQPIPNFVTSGVTSFYYMWGFTNLSPKFNQDVGHFTFESAASPSQDGFNGVVNMFKNATSFNNGGSPSISGWTFPSTVTSMEGMFYDARDFNQPIGSWDVSNITNMKQMFAAGSINDFDQDISGWNVSGVTDFSGFRNSPDPNGKFSINNYNAILTGWTGWDGSTATKTLQPNVSFGCSKCQYSSGTTAEAARNYLITGLTWTITDSGGV